MLSASKLADLLRDFLNNNEESKLHTAHMLINFKKSIRNKNEKIDKLSRNINKQKLIKMRKIAKQIISLISTWCIYIKMHIIDINDVINNLKGFLIQEGKLLEPFIKVYLNDHSSEYHYDAVDCITLFDKCKSRKENKDVQ